MMTVFGSWLHVAASHGQLKIVKYLISAGADVNKMGGILGGGPLNTAVSEGQLEIIEYLLSCGAEIDVSEPERNPLFGAIYGGYTAIAKLFIERGININIKYSGESMNEMDALVYANEWGRKEIADLILASRI